MTIRKALLAGVAAALMGVTMAVAPASAVDSPLGSGPVCDAEATQLCLSANADNGNGTYVYSKTYSDDNEEDTTVAAANVCGGTDIVDGNGTNCPFKSGSGMNTTYKNDLIIQMYNVPENHNWYIEDASVVIQDPTNQDGGYLWVLAPSGDGNYNIISVADSNGGTEYHICSGPDDGLVELTYMWSGDGSCEFVTHEN
jgi:hypothetical protein